MTVASDGRSDTPLIALGPIAFVFGLLMGYMALSSRHAHLAVDGDSFTSRQGIPTKTTSILLSDAALIRGGVGDRLAYVVVTDHHHQRIRFSLEKGPLAMRQHVATRLLASGADIDPESANGLNQLAEGPAPRGDEGARRVGVRLDSQGRLRWRRGTGISFFTAAMFIPLGVFWVLAAAPGAPRWWGIVILVIGLARGALPIYGRRMDAKQRGKSDHSGPVHHPQA